MNKLTFLSALTVFCCVITLHSFAETFVTDGLVSYWTFDQANVNNGIAEDVWGENDAQIMGNPAISAGYLRQGLDFDGSGDYVIMPNIGEYLSSITPSSIEFWFKSTQNSRPSTLYKVLESTCGEKDRGTGIDINLHNEIVIPRNGPPPPGGIQGEKVFKESSFLVQFADFNRNSCSSSSTTYRIPVSDGKWHHLVLVTGALHIDLEGLRWAQNFLYIDNIRYPLFRYRGRNPDDFRAYTEPIYLGATNDQGEARRYYFQGSFDEVRVYDRALTHNEVTQNFAINDAWSVEPIDKLPMVWGQLKRR